MSTWKFIFTHLQILICTHYIVHERYFAFICLYLHNFSKSIERFIKMIIDFGSKIS